MRLTTSTVLAAIAAAVVSCATAAPAPAPVANNPPVVNAPAAGSARGAVDFSHLEREVFAELNSARSNPHAYAANITPLLSSFNGNLLRRPGWPYQVQTKEGAAAVREAINALGSQSRVSALTFSEAMSKAARDLANDQARTGQIGHTGADGSSPATRLNRYGDWGLNYSENIDYGSVVSGRDVVEDMIIDDGVPDRGHRKNTFDASARVVGIGCASHPRYGVVCVIDQAGSFTPR